MFTNWRHGITGIDTVKGKVAWEKSVFNQQKADRAIGSPVVAAPVLPRSGERSYNTRNPNMKNHKTNSKMQTMPFLVAATLLLMSGRVATAAGGGWMSLGADDNFAAWHQPTGDWYSAGDAMLDPDNDRRLAGKPGTGVIINGKTGRTPSLVTKQVFADVEVHVEFMVAKGSNSGVIFHGNHEIQILDSHHVKNPSGGHCGGIYPRAENEPAYHHIDEGSPPKVNAAKPPGEWQTMDIIFQAARFDENGTKTAHAKFVKVVHNGRVIQENHEVPWACGPNWDRKQFPRGPVIFQGDYGPVAYRNIRVRPWKANDEKELNVPPAEFTALFNGKDFTGWRMSPGAKEMWSVEDGILKTCWSLPLEWSSQTFREDQYVRTISTQRTFHSDEPIFCCFRISDATPGITSLIS